MRYKFNIWLVALIFLIFAAPVMAVPLSGNYTVGFGGSYPDLTAAFNAVNANGLSGDVTFTIDDTGDNNTIEESGTPTLTAPFTGGGEDTWRVTVDVIATPAQIIDAGGAANILNLTDIVRFTVDGSNGTLTLQNSSDHGIAINKTAPNASDNILIKSVVIRTVGTGANSAAVYLANSDVKNVTVQNCTVTGDTYAVLSNGATNINITGGMYSDSAAPYPTNVIRISNGNNFTIQSCTLKDCDGDAVYITATAATSAINLTSVTISNAGIGANSAAIYLDNSNVQGVTVQNCTVTGDTYAVLSNGATNININGGTYSDAAAPYPTNVIRINNGSNFTIQNCTLKDCDGDAVYITATAPTSVISISSVNISNVGLGANSAAIYFDNSNVQDVTVQNCTVTGDTYAILSNGASDIVVDGGTYSDSAAPYPANVIRISEGNTFTIQNCTLRDCSEDAVYITATSATSAMLVSNVTFTSGTIGSTGNFSTIYLANEYVQDVTIQNCTNLNGDYYGIYINGCSDISISGNTIRNTQDNGIMVDNLTATDTALISITGNTFNNTIGSAGNAAAIYLANNKVKGVTISNNTINADYYGIRMESADNITISGTNTISSTGSHGIYINTTTALSSISISSLTTSASPNNVGQDVNAAAIYMANELVRNVTISGCTLNGDYYGIWMNGCQNINIQGATAVQNTERHGIYFENTTGVPTPLLSPVTIDNVSFSSIGTTAGAYAAIYLNGSDVRYVTIQNCASIVADSNGYGIWLNSARNVTMLTNTITGTPSGTTSSIYLANANTVLIEDCTIGSAGVAGSGGNYGILNQSSDLVTIQSSNPPTNITTIQRTALHGIYINNTVASTSFVISDVTFSNIGTAGAGIRLGNANAVGVSITDCTIGGGMYGVSSNAAGFSITGGTISGQTQDGIYIENATATPTPAISISSLTVNSTGSGGNYAGIHLLGRYVQNVTIQGCTINNSDYYGIWMQQNGIETVGPSNITINGTTSIQNTSYAIMSDSCDNVAISDSSMQTASYGIYFDNTTISNTPNTSPITVDNVTFSGISGTAIALNDTDVKMVTIQNCASIDGGSYGITTNGCDQTTITACTITSCDYYGIYVNNTGGGTVNTFNITNLTISGIGGSGVYGAIRVDNTDNVTISGCTITADTDGYGIMFESGSDSADIATTSVTVSDAAVAAIRISGSNTPTVGPTVTVDATAASDPTGPIGIWIAGPVIDGTIKNTSLTGFYNYPVYADTASNLTIQNNTIDLNSNTNYGIYMLNTPAKFTITGNTVRNFDSTGIYIVCTNTVANSSIARNVLEGNAAAVSYSSYNYGIYLSATDGSAAQRCTAANNIIYNSTASCVYLTDSSYWNFYYNSFYGDIPFDTFAVVNVQASSTDNTFKNNIFQNTGYITTDAAGTQDYSLCYYIDSTSQSNFSSDYNCFYGTGTNTLFAWGTGYYNALADWQASPNTPDLNSITANPWFLNPSGDDMHIWYYSECKGKAVPIGTITDDFEGNLRDVAVPDIGADEDLSAAPAPAPANGNLDIGGGANDYANLQTALTALSTRGISGDTTLTVWTNTTFTGGGAVTVPAVRGAAYSSLVPAKTLTILANTPGLLIDAESSTSYAVQINGGTNTVIDGFTLQNSLSHSVYFTGNSYDVQIKNCAIQNIDTNADESADVTMPSGNPFPGAAGIHIGTSACDNITVTDCTITADAYGIHADYSDGLSVSGTALPGTQITGVSTSTFIGILIRYSNDSVISDNTVTGTIGLLWNPPSTYRGYGIRSSYCDNLQVLGNSFSGTQPTGMEIVRGSIATIQNNTMSSVSTSGIQLNNVPGIIADNTITLQASSYNAIGLNASDLTDIGGTVIDSNMLKSAQFGINIIGGWGTALNPCVIKNNVIYDTGFSCIRLAAASYWRVYFNSCYASISSSSYGIVRLEQMDPNDGAEPPGVTPSEYNEFYQNIFFNYNYASDYSQIYYIADSASMNGFVSDNNDLYGTGTNQMFYRYGTRYNTLALWQSASAQDADSISLNPYFTDPAAGDFSIWDFSPCQNRWANTTGVTVDMNDTVRSSPPDAGAIEDAVIGADNRRTGTLYVGGATPDYSTIADAYNDLVTNGINGSVTIDVAPGTYPVISMASQIRGTTSTAIVTFASSGTPAFIDAASTADYALEITNTSNIAFDNFLFENSLSHSVSITGNSWNITFNNCTVQNVDTNNDDEGASSFYISSSAADEINITDCTIQPDLTSNTLQPPYATGIYIESGDDALISGNTLNGGADVWGNIFLLESDRSDITANIIYSGMVGIMVANSNGLTTSDPIYVTNNVVYLARYGIYFSSTTYANAYYNTLFCEPAAGESIIRLDASTYIKVKNNIINNTAGANFLISVNATSTTGFESNYNDYYSSGAYNLYWSTTTYNTITAWSSASGEDLSSISYEPELVDPANGDFHILERIGTQLMDTGTSVENAPGLTDTDFEGTQRTVLPATEPMPDLGADEAPPDVTPPDNVSNFSMLTGTNQIFLYWTNPDYSPTPPYSPLWNIDFVGVLILRDTSPITVTPTDGQIYALNSSIGTAKVVYNQSSSTGAAMSWIDTGSGIVGGLTMYQTYYYRIFTYDERPNYPVTEVSGSMMPTNPITLDYTPVSFNTSSSEKGLNPSDLIMEIWNSGDRNMAWTASVTSTWVSISPLSGSVAGPYTTTYDKDYLTLTFSIGALKIGTYFTYITLTADDPEPGVPDTVKTIPVTLDILPPPTLERSPSSLSFNAMETEPNPDAQAVQIWNGGSSYFTWSATSNVSWLSMSPNAGSIASTTENMNVTADISGLAPGTYTGKITITAEGISLIGSPKIVNVTLTVDAKPPEIAVNQDSFTWYAVQGGDSPAPQDMFIWNSSGGSIPLNWTLTENISWLAADSLTNTSAGTSTVNKVKLSVDSTNLTIVNSPYLGTMNISAVGAQSSKTISVRLEVLKTLPPSIETSPSYITVNAIEGTDSTASSFKIRNSGGSIMSYIVDDDMSWLFLQTTNGQSVGDTDTIGFTIMLSGLSSAASPYTGYIYVKANDATNSPVMIPVTLNVYPATTSYIKVEAGGKNTQNTTESTMAAQLEMLQFSITASSSENVKLASVTITSSGTGDESLDILPGNVKLHVDVNNNGVLDSDDIQLGDGTSFTENDQELTITNFNLTIPDGVTKYLLLTYSLSGTADQDKTFQASIADSLHVSAVLESTEEILLVIGTFPIEGGVKTVSNTGSLTVALGPANPSPQTTSNANTNVAVFQFAITTSSVEQIAIGSIIFSSLGSGNEPSDILRAYLVKDTNGNGRWDTDEASITPYSQVYTKDNGNISFTGLSEIIPVAATVYWLLVYDFSGSAVNGSTYNTWLSNDSSISAKGLSSNKSTMIVGTPLQSGVITTSGDPVKVVTITEEEDTSKAFCFISHATEKSLAGTVMFVLCAALVLSAAGMIYKQRTW